MSLRKGAELMSTWADLERSWKLSLRARRISPLTIDAYTKATKQLAAHSGIEEVEQITKAHVEEFIVWLLDNNRASATVNQRYRSLVQFFKWATEEAEIEVNPMARMKPPTIIEEPRDLLTPQEMAKLMKSLQRKTFIERRDLAIISLLSDTGMRRGELVGMTSESIDFDRLLVSVFGKGSKFRTLPLSETTASILDRYLSERRKHSQAHLKAFWLAPRGALTGDGVAQMLRRRGKAIGIEGLHAHQLRHGWVNDFLTAGGQESDLMKLAGWSSSEMVRRYGSALAEERAIEAGRKFLNSRS